MYFPSTQQTSERRTRSNTALRCNDTRPFKQKYRRIPPAMIEEVRTHIQEFLTSGVIRASHSPVSSNVVLVRKHDGSQVSQGENSVYCWAIGVLRIQQDELRISQCSSNVPTSSKGVPWRLHLKICYIYLDDLITFYLRSTLTDLDKSFM